MAEQYQNGGWYGGRQAWNGVLGPPGVIINPNQQGYQQPVSAAVNQQSSIAQGLAPNAIQNYLQQQSAQPSTSGGGSGAYGGGGGGVFDMAQSILNFQNQANKPVVDALNAEKAPLEQRYNDLLAKIKGDQTTAENRQTTATNTELGNRGIDPSSGLFQQTLASAVNPITQQYAQLNKEATTAQSQDSADLAVRIAQAQAGDPLQALSLAQSLSSTKQSNPYIDVGNSSSLFNTQTGQFVSNPNSTAMATTGW